MNLKSCNNCYIVIDANKIEIREDATNDDGSINTNLAEWIDGKFVSFIKCPICQNHIILA